MKVERHHTGPRRWFLSEEDQHTRPCGFYFWDDRSACYGPFLLEADAELAMSDFMERETSFGR